MLRASRTDRSPAEAGFTLIELLVALAVFSIACLIAYRGLDAVASTKGSLDREIRFWRELGLVFDRMEADFLQSVPHPLRTGQDAEMRPVQGGNDGNQDFIVELVRYDEQRAPLHVLYRCTSGDLVLSLGPSIRGTAEAGTAPVRMRNTVLLRSIERCELSFLDAGGSWTAAWPGDLAQLRPRAIRIGLTLAGHGRFERVFHLP